MATKNEITRWLNGIPYEVAFWNNVYRWENTFQGMMGWSHYGSPITLEDFEANAFLVERAAPIVLDVGCGMSYATGNFLLQDGQQVPLDIHYVDALAYHFNRILSKYKRNLPSIEFGMAEYLSAFYPDNYADLVIIQNALDHSSRPMKAIYEALEVVKKGGVLYLNHHPNEAETEQYKGFHQNNIDEADGQLIIWNKSERHIVNTLVSSFAEVKTSRYENGHIIAVITKKQDVPCELLTRREDIHELCDVVVQKSSSKPFGTAFKNRLLYMKYNFIQFFVQSLSWENKMKLKKLIHQTPKQ